MGKREDFEEESVQDANLVGTLGGALVLLSRRPVGDRYDKALEEVAEGLLWLAQRWRWRRTRSVVTRSEVPDAPGS
jgi:hypothetical protein